MLKLQIWGSPHLENLHRSYSNLYTGRGKEGFGEEIHTGADGGRGAWRERLSRPRTSISGVYIARIDRESRYLDDFSIVQGVVDKAGVDEPIDPKLRVMSEEEYGLCNVGVFEAV